MSTKTKKTKAIRGRPRKDFSGIELKKNTTNEVRPRGRPRKEKRIEDSVNTKIHNHKKDISQLSKEHDKMNFDIENKSFESKKIKKHHNKKSDNFALGLLIFSMLIFIFSLYKTFYTNHKDIEPKISNITNEQLENKEKVDDTEALVLENTEVEKIDNINYEGEKKDVSTEDIEIIKTFYEKINNKNFAELNSLVDNYLKSSNVFRTYYNNNWLSKFVWSLINEKVYIKDIKEINLENGKVGTSYYSYTIKYKLNNNNEPFQEEWELAIVTKWEKKLIGSLQCVTVGCSKMPFFNIQRYE